MKNYSAGAVFLLALTVFTHLGCAQTLSQNNTSKKAVALVLKFTGKDGVPEHIEVYRQNIFEGKVKSIKTSSASQFSEPVHVKFFNGSDQLIYEEFAQNPLKQNMESFEPGGPIQRNEVQNNTGYLNIRFGIEADVKDVKMVCYKISKGEETVLSTLNISIP